MQTATSHIHPYLQSLTHCVHKMMAEGFTTEFQLQETGGLTTREQRSYAPHEVEVINSFHFSGKEPRQGSAWLLTLQTADGTRGTLIDTHPAGSPQLRQLLQQAGKKIS